jgi:ribonuclease HI
MAQKMDFYPIFAPYYFFTVQKKQKYYVVWKGHHPGIYERWSDCQDQINAYTSPMYMSFDTKEEASLAYRDNPNNYIGKKGKKTAETLLNLDMPKPQLFSLCVDAACSGNPGVLEYQGVFGETGTRVFHVGPFPLGTVNIGEFLAVVHALAYLKKNKLDMPVYSDSRTAIAWVTKKQIKTNLERTPQTEKLFELLDRALIWLQKNTYTTPVLKWATEYWGEIPADFGRK